MFQPEMQLNLPAYPFKTTQRDGKSLIFDEFRQKWVRLTPEEWVRQHFVRFLNLEKHYPASLISLEHSLKYNRISFRADAVVYSTAGKPQMLVECKAPQVRVTQKVFDQVVRYNFEFQVDWLLVTNGLQHFCCRIDRTQQTYAFMREIPDYEVINLPTDSRPG